MESEQIPIKNGEIPSLGLEPTDYRRAAQAMVEYIIEYYKKLKTLKTSPDVEPGFIRQLVKDEAPFHAEKWEEVFKDLDSVIMKGTTHWQSPGFFGFFTCGNSFPSLLGEMLDSALGMAGINWAAGPSCTELETVVMDWLAKALDLPKAFLHNGTGPGAGIIKASASEATLVTLLAARTKAIQKELIENPDQTLHQVAGRLVAYTSMVAY